MGRKTYQLHNKLLKKMKNKQQTLEKELPTAESNSPIALSKTEISRRKDLAEKLDLKIKKLENTIKNEPYIIEGREKVGTYLFNFIVNEATWNATESMGIIEVHKELKTSLDNLKNKKQNEIMLKSLTLEALYYFLSKKTGTGLSGANEFFVTGLKPVIDALGRVKTDKDALDKIVLDKGTVDHSIDSGVEMNGIDNIIKEIDSENK